jgi:hypothetical protein
MAGSFLLLNILSALVFSTPFSPPPLPYSINSKSEFYFHMLEEPQKNFELDRLFSFPKAYREWSSTLRIICVAAEAIICPIPLFFLIGRGGCSGGKPDNH